MAVRRRDPNEPDFPHGTPHGYFAGCQATYPCPATPSCTESRRLQRVAARQENRTIRFYRPHTVHAYVQSYLDKGWTLRAYANAADVNEEALSRSLRGQFERMTEELARKLIAVDDLSLYDAATGMIPAYTVRWKAGSLCAIGWPCNLQAKMLGYNAPSYIRLVTGAKTMIRKVLAEDISTFFDQMRNTPSTSTQRKQALRMAEQYGFRTPDAYAPDGTLWEDDVRDETTEERWARRDRSALLHMQVAQMAVKSTLSISEMMTELNMHGPAEEQAVRRAREALGLKWTGGHTHGPKPGQQARIAKILDVVERWRLAGPLADPYPYCVELDMMTGPLWAALDGKPHLEAA